MYMGKLVRDKIPSLLQKEGKHITLLSISQSDPAFRTHLMQKLREEVDEFLREGDPKELIDVLEVIDTLLIFPEYEINKICRLQLSKRHEKGGFEKGFILMDVV